MEEKKGNGLLVVVSVLVFLIGGAVGYFVSTNFLNKNDANNSNASNTNMTTNENDTNDKNQTIKDELGKNDTFSDITNSGVVEVIGYSEVVEKGESDVDENTGKKYNYVYFHIKETKSKEFKNFINSINGNSYVLADAIGLGCIIDNEIKYYNSSDKNGDKEYFLSNEDSNKIINSTETNPVKLKLERLVYSSGSGAPVCYSHITNIEVID